MILEYLQKLDINTETYYIECKKFDESIQIMNTLFSNNLDLLQEKAQDIYPHYYERFKTDGIDYNLYIGKSITPKKEFDYDIVKKLRFWQLQVAIILERIYNNTEKIPFKMEVASLIYATNTTLDIQFKLDEKRFDVNGYNNAKYEIVKKRISKALIKGSNERINQPKKICIVYSDEMLKDEYIEYINLLIEDNYLKNDVEFLEVQDLQGIRGLKIIRISINYEKQAIYKKFREKNSNAIIPLLDSTQLQKFQSRKSFEQFL